MDILTEAEKKTLVKNTRKHLERVFPGRDGIGRLAKAASVSSQSLSQWLSGKRTPSPARLYALAKALGVDVYELRGKRKAKAAAPGKALPEIVQGQIAAIDTLILLLRYNKQALLDETDAKRYRECVRSNREFGGRGTGRRAINRWSWSLLTWGRRHFGGAPFCS